MPPASGTLVSRMIVSEVPVSGSFGPTRRRPRNREWRRTGSPRPGRRPHHVRNFVQTPDKSACKSMHRTRDGSAARATVRAEAAEGALPRRRGGIAIPDRSRCHRFCCSAWARFRHDAADPCRLGPGAVLDALGDGGKIAALSFPRTTHEQVKSPGSVPSSRKTARLEPLVDLSFGRTEMLTNTTNDTTNLARRVATRRR